MLREILRDNLDQLLLTVDKIAYAFEIVTNKSVDKSDLLEIKRLIHSLKGNLQAIGLHDDAELAKHLEEYIFNFIDKSSEDEIFIAKYVIDDWFTKLNEIEFNLKSYMF
jgi:chemotaxis protein histidine kinase CheA